MPRSLRESPRSPGAGGKGQGVDAGTSLEGTEVTVCPTGWLHPQSGYTQEPRATPGLAPPALLGIAQAAGCLQGRAGFHPHGSSSKRSSVTSLEMAPTLPPFISHQWEPGRPSPLGTGMRGRLSAESQRNGGLMTREGHEDGGSSQGPAGHP